MKFCVARSFGVERHLDVILDVLQVVGSKNVFFSQCVDINLISLPKPLIRQVVSNLGCRSFFLKYLYEMEKFRLVGGLV